MQPGTAMAPRQSVMLKVADFGSLFASQFPSNVLEYSYCSKYPDPDIPKCLLTAGIFMSHTHSPQPAYRAVRLEPAPYTGAPQKAVVGRLHT